MCGIFAILGKTGCNECLRRQAIYQSKKMKHRGPDWSGYYMDKNVILCHERLTTVGLSNGNQPIISKDGSIVLIANGEIYNYKELMNEYKDYEFKSDSDCEVIIQQYHRYGPHFMEKNKLMGMFAFVLYDKETGICVISRDHIGIIPLYTGYRNGRTHVASEMKSLLNCRDIRIFPPGHYHTDEVFHPYYKPHWRTNIGIQRLDLKLLRTTLEKSVVSHMMSDVPFGVLLSGGLDSSLVASIATRNYEGVLNSFCIGLEGSPDIKAAEKVAKFLGTRHYSFKYTVQEGIDALEDVIYHIESYDVTTVRSSVPMYLMARKIKALGVKFVLTGEVSDEASGSYAYFKHAPNEKEFYEETVRKVTDLHRYDLLRANKSMLAWGVETRVPFGDQGVLDVMMNLKPEHKMWGRPRIEKDYLRRAFDDKEKPYLPEDMLWRKKEQFSDGVGYGWIDGLKEYADKNISDGEMAAVKFSHPMYTPKTKEEFLYRKMFDKHYRREDCLNTLPYEDSVACSTGKAMEWFGSDQVVDPSGRAVEGHESVLKNEK